MPLVDGSRFGRFRILACAGRGGMGEVYRAEDTTLNRVVALKTIRDGTRPPASPALSAYSAARFEREARVLASFGHPNAVAIYGFEVIEQTPVLIMEWLEGRSVYAIIRERGTDLEERLRWLTEAADALAALHRAGIVHRDLKPANMMVDATSRLRLLDFGVARIVEDERGAPALTGTHEVLGTPKYMAPEQRLGARVDGRADQFAWGLVAYELLTGKHPRDMLPENVRHHFPATPPETPARLEPRLGPGLSAIILRALALAPEDRFASMDDVVAALAAAPPLAPAAPVEPAPDTIRESSRRTPREPRARGPWLVFLASSGAAVALGAAGLGVLVHRGALDVPTAPDDAAGAPATIGDEPPAAARGDEPADATDAYLGDEPPATVAAVATSGAEETNADAAPRGPRARDGAASDRVRASAVHVGDVLPASSDGAVRAWIGTRRASLLACYRAHPAGRSCASTMATSISCEIAPNGTTTACATTNYAFNIREPLDCNFSDEGTRCVLRALDGTQGPLPFDTDKIRFTVTPW